MKRKQVRLPAKRMLLWAAGGLISAQAATLGILQVVSRVRRRSRPRAGFPHPDLPPVQLNGATLQIYCYGRDLYQAMLTAIDAATETIYLETFLWKDDEVGQAFKDHLARKAGEGIAVYVVYDHFGNLVVPPAFKQFPASMHALAYRGIDRPWHVLDPRRYALEHRKILTIDGRVGFVGGFNIGSVYAEHWRDTHLRVEGHDAADLADEFAGLWNKHGPADDRITRHYTRRWNPFLHVEGTNALQLTFPIRDMYIRAIDNAEKSIRLTNAYFVPDGNLVAALKRAAERGVDVQILVPWVSNHILVDWLARGYFTDFLQSGVQVFGYRSMLHAKTCTIDGQWTTIGTANLDRLSSVGNYEINAEIYNEQVARQMEELFRHDVSDAVELHWEEWRDRPWYAKLGETILAPLRDLL